MVTQDAQLPDAEIIASNNLNCTFSTAVLDGTGSSQGPGIIFTWSTTDGNFINDPTGELMPEVDQAGTYTLTINDTLNGLCDFGNHSTNAGYACAGFLL